LAVSRAGGGPAEQREQRSQSNQWSSLGRGAGGALHLHHRCVVLHQEKPSLPTMQDDVLVPFKLVHRWPYTVWKESPAPGGQSFLAVVRTALMALVLLPGVKRRQFGQPTGAGAIHNVAIRQLWW
jgi:hypothetical protein